MAETVIVTNDSANESDEPVNVDERKIDLEIGAALGEALAKIDNLEMSIAEMNARIFALENRVTVAQDSADSAADIAIDAINTAVEAEIATDEIAEVIEEIATEPEPEPIIVEPEPDNPPGKTHWLNRPAKEWRGER